MLLHDESRRDVDGPHVPDTCRHGPMPGRCAGDGEAPKGYDQERDMHQLRMEGTAMRLYEGTRRGVLHGDTQGDPGMAEVLRALSEWEALTGRDVIYVTRGVSSVSGRVWVLVRPTGMGE